MRLWRYLKLEAAIASGFLIKINCVSRGKKAEKNLEYSKTFPYYQRYVQFWGKYGGCELIGEISCFII